MSQVCCVNVSTDRSFRVSWFVFVSEDDILDGTSKIKRALLEVFYELNKGRARSFFRKRQKTTNAPSTRKSYHGRVSNNHNKTEPKDATSSQNNSSNKALTSSSVLDMEDEALL